MERGERFFKLSDVDKLSVAMDEHATMTHQVGEVKSFPLELAMIVEVLRENKMPQESINKVLAVRCGLPMQTVDHRSPCFVWEEDEPVRAEAPHAQKSEGVTPGEHIDAICDDLFKYSTAKSLSVKIHLRLIPGRKNFVAESTLELQSLVLSPPPRQMAKQQE